MIFKYIILTLNKNMRIELEKDFIVDALLMLLVTFRDHPKIRKM